jgi:hypothetical protein
MEKEKTRSILKFIEISVTLTGVTNTKRRGRNDIESLEYFDSAYLVHVTLYIHACFKSIQIISMPKYEPCKSLEYT